MIQITPIRQQYHGDLFGGVFHENRPISFPVNGRTNAYSNLFYWAHLEARDDGEFGLHPHKGFEIMTFVLKGQLEHYDTKTERWTPLKTGDVQMIQAGSGVQHAERYKRDSEGFQIWFDPDFSKTLGQNAAYTDYPAEAFVEMESDGVRTMDYVGDGAPIQLETEGLRIKKLILAVGEQRLALGSGSVYSIYVMKGAVAFDGGEADKDAFVVIQDQDRVVLTTHQETQLFVVETPKRPSYVTFVDRMN